MSEDLPYYVTEQEQEMQVMAAFGGDRGKYEVGVRVDEDYATTTAHTRRAAYDALTALVEDHDLEYAVPESTAAFFDAFRVDDRP